MFLKPHQQQNRTLFAKITRRVFFIFSAIAVFVLLFVSQQSPARAEMEVKVKKEFEALKIIQSHQEIKLESGKAITFQVGFKNIGSKTWKKEGDNAVRLVTKNSSGAILDPFYHSFWPGKSYPAKMTTKETKPGEIAYFRFALQAPTSSGKFVEEFQLNIGDALWMDGGLIQIPIEVKGDETPPTSQSLSTSSSYPTPTQTNSQETSNAETPQINSTINEKLKNKEPIIRIGLFSTTESVQITANNGFQIWDQNNNLLYDFNPGKTAVVNFNFSAQQYMVDAPPISKSFSSFFKFVPKTSGTIFEIANYEHRPVWNPEINDNAFEGQLEIRYAPSTGKLWVINELPIEAYLHGLAESSNSSPAQFQKALITAARTYALYHYLNPKKHADENFTVDATYDQIYRGYNAAKRLTAVVQAVEETRGQIVTYNNELTITPYFSQSDGRTRSWQEVWGGEAKPWLVSVSDPHNSGKEKLGHGVGMSAQGAIGFAQEGKTYREILKYYYTGVEIERVY